MKLKKQAHFWLITIATILILWEVFEYTPNNIIEGNDTFRALVWSKHNFNLIKSIACYLAFCMLVLGHAASITLSRLNTTNVEKKKI